MKINLIILCVLFSAGLGWAYTSFSPKVVEKNAFIEDLVSAETFQYTTIQGRTGSLENHKGQVVLLHFWATWCAPCLVEFPDIIKLAEQSSKNLTILAISSNEARTDIDKFISNLKTSIPNNLILIHDEDKNITNTLFNVKKLPETILLDQNLKIVKKYIGPQTTWNKEIFQNDIKPLFQ